MTKFFQKYKIILILFVFILVKIQAHVTISSDLYTKKTTPAEIIVDTTNDLAYRIIYYHSISNRNNFAFSPTSLISVIIALYEGSYDRSYSELQNFLELPQIKDTSRIGLRDIHRRLRTYFFPQDNPLNGLCFNKENITITPEYEAILKFYGYDLDFTATDIQTFISEAPDIIKINSTLEVNLVTEISMQNFSTSTITTITEANQTDTVTTFKTLINNTEVEIISTTEKTMVTTTNIAEEITTSTEITNTESPELAAYVSSKINYNSGKSKKISDYWPTSSNVSSQSFHIYPAVILKKENINKMNNNQTERLNVRNRKISNNQIKSTRSKRFLLNDLINLKHFNQPTFINPYKFLINKEGATLTHAVNPQDYSSLPIPLHFTPIIKLANVGEFGIEIDSRYQFPKETSLKSTINHIFYLNNHETIQANYKTYNSVLNYKYLAAQKITILELELNSANYNLIIFLPDFNINIETAVKSLKTIPSLRFLKKIMKPKWVQAIIPDFRLRGKIYLTNDLQNMEVKDIFEPSRADFSLMSNENDIYVKHIEQIIDINIRTRPIDQIKGNIAQEFQPIEVAVNHPFLFFIVDKEIDVAIIAGRAINPLNLRIQ